MRNAIQQILFTTHNAIHILNTEFKSMLHMPVPPRYKPLWCLIMWLDWQPEKTAMGDESAEIRIRIYTDGRQGVRLPLTHNAVMRICQFFIG